MEESLSSVKIVSCKRKEASLSTSSNPNPSTGISTSSTSRIYFHRNRSGLSRPDPVPSRSIPRYKPVEAFLDTNCSDSSRVSSIKDLRIKRIFSPDVNSVPQIEKEEEEKDEERRKGSDPSADEGNAMADTLVLQDQAINVSLSKNKMALNRCFPRKVFKSSSSSFSYRRMLPYLMDIVNDPSSVSKIEIVGDGISCGLDDVNSEVRSVSLFDNPKPSENQDLEKVNIMEPKGLENEMNGVDEEECVQTTPPDPCIFTKTEVGESMEMSLVGSGKSNGDALKQSPNSKLITNSTKRSVLNPCYQSRLFKNPRSLSYKRLLPFLMDISNVNSCASTKAQNLLSSVVPPCQSDASSPDSSNNSQVSSMPLPSSIDSSNDEPSSIEIPNIQTCPSKPETCLESEERSDNPAKQCTSEEPGPVGKQKMCLNVGLELHNSNPETVEKMKSKQNSFQVKAWDALVSPNYGPPKGILKINRRGCRGLCNCLNCASFRLHADRAFEFSRNQMQDAEEVVSELMRELANLRVLLEKSIMTATDCAGIQHDQVLIKQACNKAMEAETMAKDRLKEMNYDLNVHCRIPALFQPKVTFANNIQERAIPPVLD